MISLCSLQGEINDDCLLIKANQLILDWQLEIQGEHFSLTMDIRLDFVILVLLSKFHSMNSTNLEHEEDCPWDFMPLNAFVQAGFLINRVFGVS